MKTAKILSVFLVIVVIISLFPMTAYAINDMVKDTCVSTGDCILMGTKNNKRISWTVLSVQEDVALLHCNYVLDILSYGPTTSYTYASAFAPWCANFYSSDVFNEEERNAILSTTVSGCTNQKLFLFSKSEFLAYFPNGEDGYRPLFPGVSGAIGAVGLGTISITDDNLSYYLASTSLGSNWLDLASYESHNYKSATSSNLRMYQVIYGVCPAMYVDLDQIDDCQILHKGQEMISSIAAGIDSEHYGIFVQDSSGKAVAGATVTYDSQTKVTDENGLALFWKLTAGQPKITVTCDGYEPYSNEDTNYEKSELGYDVIKLYTKEEGAYKLSSAYYQNVTGNSPNGKKTDVLSGTKRISLGVVLPGTIQGSVSTKFRLECAVSKDKRDVVRTYQLWQGEKKIAESDDGTFALLKTSDFSKDGDVFVRVIVRDETTVDTPINLIFVKETSVKQSNWKFGFDKLTVSVADDIPFLGGSKISISMPQFPMDIYVSEDTVHVGINVDFTAEDENAYQKKVDKLRTLVKNYRYMAAHPDYQFGKTLQGDLNFLMKSKNLKADVGFDVDCSFIGYGEGKIDENGLANVKVYLCLVVEGSMKIQGPTVIVVVVPMTYSVKGSIKATLGAEAGYDLENQTLTGDVTLTVAPKLNIFGGVGLGKVTGAGAYGEAKLTSEIQLIGTTNSTGVNSVDLTGEAGFKAYFGPFEYTKAFVHQTWHLYTRTKSLRTASRAAEEFTLDELYDQDSYTPADLSYLTEESDWLGDGGASAIADGLTGTATTANTLTALQKNTYRNMQPVIGYADDTPMMVWVRANTERGEYDYPQLVYSVYNGGWSQPQPVWPENHTADAAPAVSTAADGTLWLAWQSSARQMTAEDTLSDLAAMQTVVVAKFDLETGNFAEFQTVSETGVFSKNPAICAEDDDVTVAWIANTDSSDYFGQNTTNAICYASQSGNWAVSTAASGLGAVTELAVGQYQGMTGFAYVADGDENLCTADDRTLYLADGSSAVTVATGALATPTFGVLPGETAQSLLYTDGAALYRYNGTAETVLEDMSLENGFAVTSDRLIYAAADPDGGCAQLYCRSYDGTGWTETVQLTEQNQYLQSYSVLELNGKVYLAAVQADVVITSDTVDDQCTLSWAILDSMTDLAITEVYADPEQEVPGQAVPVSVTVKNCGDTAVNSYVVTVAADGKTVATKTVNEVLAAGAENTLTVDVTLGATVTKTDYTVTVSAAGDGRSDNNTGNVTMGYCDLALHTQLIQLGTSRTLLVKVANEGAVTSGGSLTVDCGAGRKLADIPSLAYGESAFYLIPLTREDLGGLSGMVEIQLQAAQSDWDSFNDTDAQYVSIPYEEGFAITAVSGQMVTVQLQNRTAGTLYVAAYTANGQMVTMTAKSVTADAGE